jgi:NADPH:quinone reductase-like Zn-dependent oxidoreductase
LVGQAATAIARWRGAEPIIADRRRPDGVEHFIDTGSADVREAVLELTDGRGADMVLDAVGGALFEPALRSLRFGGRMAGLISHEPRVEFDLVEFYGRELHLTGLASVFMDGSTSRASSANSVRCSTAALLPLRPSKRGRSRTALGLIRRCWTGRTELSRCY